MKVIDYDNVELLRQELIVFRPATLSVEAGQMVYLIGRVGCGKSTLLKSMYAEVPVHSATRATVLGRDLTSLRRRDIPMLRRDMGIVFQDFQLLRDRSVQANLEFVLRATGWRDRHDIDRRIASTLARVGMENKSYKMPHELSGGEQQRVVIARALLNNPKLILADEPTGNLDPDTGTQIVAQLAEIARAGTAVVMATHNMAWPSQFPGRTLRCEDKHIIE